MFRGDDSAAFARAAGAAKLVRFGADCYASGLVALGVADLVVEASLQLYDFAPMGPIVEGAGGIVTDWQGRPLGFGSDGRVAIAGDRRAHAETLALLQG
jgi:fructose-1,6-bisphosphatase/inositol monophosphatase family enzyme